MKRLPDERPPVLNYDAPSKRSKLDYRATRIVALISCIAFSALTVKLCVDPTWTKVYPSPISHISRIPMSIWLSAAGALFCLLVAIGRIR